MPDGDGASVDDFVDLGIVPDKFIFHQLPTEEAWRPAILVPGQAHAAGALGSNFRSTLTLRRGDGTLAAEASHQILAGQALFLSRYLSTMLGGAEIADGWILVEADLADAVYPWASSVDNESTDQTFVRPTAACVECGATSGVPQ